jgi:hypothetical protein
MQEHSFEGQRTRGIDMKLNATLLSALVAIAAASSAVTSNAAPTTANTCSQGACQIDVSVVQASPCTYKLSQDPLTVTKKNVTLIWRLDKPAYDAGWRFHITSGVSLPNAMEFPGQTHDFFHRTVTVTDVNSSPAGQTVSYPYTITLVKWYNIFETCAIDPTIANQG